MIRFHFARLWATPAGFSREGAGGILVFIMSAIPPVPYQSQYSHVPVTTTFTIEGYRIVQYLGIVRGLIVRSPTIAQGFLGGLKSIIGGQIGAYSDMCEQTRQQAYELLLQHALAVGANAVVGFRYDASEIGGGRGMSATEVLCYGTAVVITPETKG
jgi:uncharacterized protein YbjQ (UPF0145 family)